MLSFLADVGFSEIINYELVAGNQIWRFAAVLVIMIVSLAAGKTVQFFFKKFGILKPEKMNHSLLRLIIGSLAKPANVFVLAIGFKLCGFCLVFDNPNTSDIVEGIQAAMKVGWGKTSRALFAISIGYALFSLVDVVEFYLRKVTVKTETLLDDMLIPVIRKSLRITIGIISALFIAENIFGEGQIKSFLLSAGIGGIAIALAAKDTLANFFGSVTIFADRPFHINELVKIDGYLGMIEEVGIRSSKLRTMEGHLVTVPNSVIANSYIENLGKRPFVRRTSNITITYDAGPEKAAKAVAIIKDILADIPEVNASKDHAPRVYFDEFNDWSLNIYMTYWVSPPDWWQFKEVSQKVNLEMMKRFDEAGIEFAFPSQTLYLKNE